MKRKIVLTVVVFLSLFFFFCAKPEKPVAKIGGNWVSFEQFKTFLNSHQFRDFDDQEKLNKAFEEFIKRELAYERAKRKGLLAGKSWENQKDKIERNAVIYNFILSKYLNGASEPSEDEMYEIYKMDNAKRHLWGVGVKGKENALEVAKALKSGGDIEKIFEQHKNDLPNGPKSYDIGYPKFNELPPEIQKLFFSGNEGDVIEPIQFSQDGFMVVVLRELQLPPKQAKYDQMVARKALGLKFQKAMAKCNDEYKNYFPDTYESQTVSELIKSEKPTEEELNKTVGKVGSKKIKYADLLETYYNDIQRGANLPQNEETYKKVFDKIALETRVYLAGEKEKFLKDKKVDLEIWEKTHEAGASMCYQDFANEFAVKDEELKNYYEKNKNKFAGQASYNLRYLLSKAPEDLNNAVILFKKGAKWEDILKSPGILPETGAGILGWKNQDEIGSMMPQNIAEKLKSIEKGKWLADRIGPERLIAIYVEDKKQGEVSPFDQVREKVRELYIRENGPKLFEDFLQNEVWNSIKVETYPQNLK
jgi:parvulin-like peptidyl-prolyl isomerase